MPLTKRYPLLALSLVIAFAASCGVAAAAAPLTLADLQGVHRTIPQPGAKATVLFFIAHDCPISLSYAPKMNTLAKEYTPKGIAFYIVYAEPDLKLDTARSHDNAYGYVCPAILDNKLAITRETDALATPEAIVLSPSGAALYRGRIDNLYAGYGVRRPRNTTDDLKEALDAIMAGKPVPHPSTKVIGCFIPRQ
jgi:hypothetical protein